MTNNENLLTLTDVATRLNISRMTAYRMVKAGKLPAVRVGRNLRIRPADLEAFIAGAIETPGLATNKTGGGG
jgi:excisionase family DNA binding protein